MLQFLLQNLDNLEKELENIFASQFVPNDAKIKALMGMQQRLET